MFKALAEFVMRGRVSAIIVALLGSWISLLSQAALGVVTLRKGWREGALITLWACLPILVGLWLERVPVLLVHTALGVMIVTYLGCCVLRASVSWPVTLMAMVGLSVMSAIVIELITADTKQQMVAALERMVTSPSGEITPEARSFVDNWPVDQIGSWVAVAISTTAILGLVFARWWQALVYNPGGFQSEFHALRLPKALAIVSALATIYCSTQGPSYLYWSYLFSLPLCVAGLGLGHWLVSRYKLGSLGVVVLYFVALVATLLLILLALLDASLDLRKKFKIDQSS